MRWIDFPSPDAELRGIVGEPRALLHRLPDSYRSALPDDTWDRTLMPSGVRVAFRTDSSRLALRMEYLDCVPRATLVDAYLDGTYRNSAGHAEVGPCQVTVLEELSGQHEIELYLPPYAEIRLDAIGLTAGAAIAAPTSRARPLLVFHGDSITHGAITRRAALTYPARMARALDADFINLGVGGAARGEPGMAALIANLPADAVVLAFGIISFSQASEPPDAFRATYGAFLETIRGRLPEVPILALTPTYYTLERTHLNAHEAALEDYRRAIRQAVGRRQSEGDPHLLLVEGFSIMGPGDEDYLADSHHPNDQGMAAFADRLAPILRPLVAPSRQVSG